MSKSDLEGSTISDILIINFRVMSNQNYEDSSGDGKCTMRLSGAVN